MQIVQYYKEYKNEEPFIMNGEKWVYCWGKYPDGKIDIAVYRYGTDLAYDYSDFRAAMDIDKNQTQNNLQENMENTINEKVMKLKSVAEQLEKMAEEYKKQTAELEAVKDQLVPEVLEAFKGQTKGAEKLKVEVDGLMVEIVQAHEKKTISYKVMSELMMEELARLDIALGKTAQQLQEDSKVAQKVKGQLKIGGVKVYEGESDDFSEKVINWLDKSNNFKNKNIEKAETSIEAIKRELQQHDDMDADKYASQNMDDVEAGAITEADVIKNAATKHVQGGLKGDSSVTKAQSLPTSGGQVIKNAATKDMTKGSGEKLTGEKSLEEPTKVDGVIKNAADKHVKNGKTEGPAAQNIEKQPTSGGQAIKNAATKDMAKSSGTKLSTAKPKVVSEDLNANDGINKMDEDNETIKNAATKDIDGGKTEVSGKKSELENMEEESFMKMRAGANGKVYESEMEEENWMEEGDHEETEETPIDEGNHEETEEKPTDEVDEKLNEAINRFKQIINY